MTRLTTPALSGSPPVASPLVPFTPVTGTAYLDARPIMRAAPDHPWIGFDSDTLYRGIFQVDAVVPVDAGEGQGLRLAALVVERFAIGTMLALSASRLKVLQPPAIAPVIVETAWARYPVSIAYLVVC
jgi:hypothetical protein